MQVGTSLYGYPPIILLKPLKVYHYPYVQNRMISMIKSQRRLIGMKDSYLDALAYYGIDGAHPGGFSLTQNLLTKENINNQMKVLDAGCGTGQTSQFLAETFGCQVYAVDNHPEMIRKSVHRFQQKKLPVQVFLSPIEELPFPENFFDYIIAESTTGFTDLHSTLSEYFRVLKTEGTLLSIDMTAEPSLTSYQKDELLAFYQLTVIPSEEEWIHAFYQHGFKEVNILESNKVLDELKNYSASNQRSEPSAIPDALLHETIQEHFRLMLTYGNSIGYRVFKVRKQPT